MNSTNALSRTILLCRDYVSDEQTDDEIADAFRSLRVLCVADEASASSHSGQTALVTLVSLLSRMGITVGLAVPDVPLTLAQPPFEGDGVRSALLLASGRIMPDASIVSAAASFSPNIVFFLGAEPLNDHTTQSWQMSATEWSGSIGPAHIGLPRSFGGEWPIGAMVSALLAANEAFKCAIRRLRLRHPFHEVFFQPSLSCRWDFGTVATPRGSLKIGPVDFISGGAISQAALFALARVPRLAMRLRAFDDDITERSNLNRNMLTLLEDVRCRKVDVIASRCGDLFEITPMQLRFDEAIAANTKLASRVMVGVDDIPSRWLVQQVAPGWVGVGGTSHFSISCSSHAVGQACSGCMHPVDDPDGANPIPTVSFVSFWAGLALAVRLLREALGTPYPSDQQQLWITPLRLDLGHAAIWQPVPAVKNCPVHCAASFRA